MIGSDASSSQGARSKARGVKARAFSPHLKSEGAVASAGLALAVRFACFRQPAHGCSYIKSREPFTLDALATGMLEQQALRVPSGGCQECPACKAGFKGGS